MSSGEVQTPDNYAGIYLAAELTSLGIGAAYCFAGVKFQAILHGIVCGLFFFIIAFFIGLAITFNLNASIAIGLAVGAILGFLCFKAKRIVSCVLGVQFGLMISVISYIILFSWWNVSDTIAQVWVAAGIIVSVYLTCTRPKAMLIEMTAIIGATYIVNCLLALIGENYRGGLGLW